MTTPTKPIQFTTVVLETTGLPVSGVRLFQPRIAACGVAIGCYPHPDGHPYATLGGLVHVPAEHLLHPMVQGALRVNGLDPQALVAAEWTQEACLSALAALKPRPAHVQNAAFTSAFGFTGDVDVGKWAASLFSQKGRMSQDRVSVVLRDCFDIDVEAEHPDHLGKYPDVCMKARLLARTVWALLRVRELPEERRRVEQDA